MSFFQVTSAELKNRAEELKGLNTRFASQVEALDTGEKNLKTMWEGEANEAFHAAFTNDKGQMDMFRTTIDRYIEALLVIAARYEQAEAKNTSTASARSY